MKNACTLATLGFSNGHEGALEVTKRIIKVAEAAGKF